MKKLILGFFKNTEKDSYLQVNLFPVLILVFLWTYGYIGVLTQSSSGLQIFNTICLISILLFLFFVNRYLSQTKANILFINKNDIKIFLIIFFFVLLIGIRYLAFPLVSDELWHSYASQFHAILGLELLSNYLPNYVIEQKVSLLIWFISGSMLLCSIAFFYFISKLNYKYKFIVCSIFILLVFRTIFILQGGANLPHPPFRLFPLWLSSSIFSTSIFSFRLPGLMALTLIGLIIHKSLKSKISSPFLLYLSILTIITIPIVWHSSYLVEPSIWAGLFSCLFLLVLLLKDSKDCNFFIWFALLAIFLLMRQSLIFIVLPMLFIYAVDRKTLLLKNLKETLFTLSPLLIAIPFLFKSLIDGTPSTNIPIESQLEGLSNAISSGIVIDIIINNFGIWSIFLIFAFIPTKVRRIRYFGTLLLFIGCSFIVFYSIRPAFWGVPRYQLEYLAPLIILGAVRVLIALYNSKKKINTYVLSSSLLSLLVYNLYTISIAHSVNGVKINGHSIFVTRSVYDYKTAYKTAKDNGFAGNFVMLGVTYGAMNEVLYGYSFKEFKKQSELYEKFIEGKGNNLDLLVQNQDIKLIMLSDIGDKKEYIQSALMKNGFSEWKRFSSEKTTDEVIALVRNNNNRAN